MYAARNALARLSQEAEIEHPLARHGINGTATARRRRPRLGQVAVMDRGLAAVLGAAALLGLVSVYFFTKGDSQAEAQVSQIDVITSTVASLYGSQGDYGTLYTAVVGQSGKLPPEWTALQQNVIVSMYRSYISVNAATNPTTKLDNGAYNVLLQQIPQSACTTIATSQFSGNLVLLYVGGVEVANQRNPVGDPAVVAAACAEAAKATGAVPYIELTFQ